MSTTSYTSSRRLSAFALTLLLFCVFVSKRAEGQAAPPLVTGSFATSLTAPSGLGTVVQTVLDAQGDWLVLDYPNGALYEYPAGGGAMITLAPPGTMGSVGGYQNPGITVDSNNNLYIAGNFNNCLLLFPYDTTTKTWDGLATLDTKNNNGPDQCGIAPFSFARYGLVTPVAPLTANYIQPWGLAVLPNNVLVMGSQDGGNFIFTLPVVAGPTPAGDCSGAGNCSPYATPGTAGADAATLIVLSMTKRPNSIAADKFGNIYFVEDSGGLPGAYMVPAGATNVPADTDSRIVRIDPNLANVTAVATDAAGNVYVSDSSVGVVMIPNPAGTPNTKGAVLLTTVPATGQVSVDSANGILYIPTSGGGLTKVQFNAELGSTAVGGAPAAAQTVRFGFSSAATPASFSIEEAGLATPDFTLATGGTCAPGTAYAAQSGCTQNVTLSPHAAGSVSAKLVMLDSSGNVLGSMALHGTGTGSAVQVLAGGESVIGAGLKTPSQVAVDAAGTVYVADSGLGAVEVYPKGTGAVAAKATVGKNLTAPTGVAVDGAGDVFIADSGNVIEVPNSPSGLNAAGQITLMSGLRTRLNLATDGVGHLYIADPDNNRVVKLGNLGGSFGLLGQTETDLSGPAIAVAADSNGNLYGARFGGILFEITPAGTLTLSPGDPGTSGVAVDPSGGLYEATPQGTFRIPFQSGTLTATGASTMVASDVTNATSVAIDSAENVYIADGNAEHVVMVSASASTNFGTLTSTSGTQANSYTILNAGNAPLNLTAFTGTADYSETSTTCIGAAVAVGSTCAATITFSPGPGDQGPLSGEVLIQSDAANSPVGVNVTGVGANLATSKTTVSVTKPTVDGAPAVVTVAAASGTGAAPTGKVTLTVTGTNLTTPVVATGTLANGTVTITPTQLAAGTYTFSLAYQGDRTYGPSTTSTSVTVAAGAVVLMQTPLTPALNLVQLNGTWYVLAGGNGAAEPYDGSVTQYTYTYPVTIAATDGIALIGQPVFSSTGKLVGANYGSVTYQGAPYTATGLGCPPVPVQSNGTAPLDMTCLTIDTSNTSIPNIENTYTITPVYSPTGTGSADCPTATTCVVNPNYTPVTGTPITVTALRNPMVQISSNPGSLTVSAGSTTTSTLTLSSVLGYGIGGAGSLLNNYTLPVQLACDGLPAYATCTFSYPKPDPTDPNSVDVGPAAGTVLSFGGTTGACAAAVPGAVGGCFGPGTVIMTIHTNVQTGAVAGVRRGQDDVIFAAMFGLGLLSFAFGKKKSLRSRIPTLVCLVLCGGIMMGISGCSTKQLGTSSGTVATPAGTYQVLVTAKQVGSQVITAVPGITYGNGHQVSLPFTVSLTVQ